MPCTGATRTTCTLATYVLKLMHYMATKMPPAKTTRLDVRRRGPLQQKIFIMITPHTILVDEQKINFFQALATSFISMISRNISFIPQIMWTKVELFWGERGGGYDIRCFSRNTKLKKWPFFSDILHTIGALCCLIRMQLGPGVPAATTTRLVPLGSHLSGLLDLPSHAD